MGMGWCVARTRPLAEYAADEWLEQREYQVFLPCVKTERPRLGHSTVPLFPGYLFLRYDVDTGR